jgi:hypothetical protein
MLRCGSGIQVGQAALGVQSQQALLDRGGDEAAELLDGLLWCELDQQPGDGADAELSVGADVLGVGLGLGAVDGETGTLPASRSGDRQVDASKVEWSEVPDGRRGPVAEEGLRPGTEEGRQKVRAVRQ